MSRRAIIGGAGWSRIWGRFCGWGGVTGGAWGCGGGSGWVDGLFRLICDVEIGCTFMRVVPWEVDVRIEEADVNRLIRWPEPVLFTLKMVWF